MCVVDNTFATPLLQRPLDADGGVERTLERRARYPAERGIVPDDLLRVSVGCEHVEDLWADLEHALACTAGLRDAGAVRG